MLVVQLAMVPAIQMDRIARTARNKMHRIRITIVIDIFLDEFDLLCEEGGSN